MIRGEALNWAGDAHLRVRIADAPSPEADLAVQRALTRLRGANVTGLVDITPAYGTLLLAFDLAALDPRAAEAQVRQALTTTEASDQPSEPRLIDIPVCYGGACGPDLEDVAARAGLSVPEAIAMHSTAEYTVRFIGFSPGFPYLAGLPAPLHAPRLDTPRSRVAAGSVAIAGDQAGIYPRQTPGGWRLIGRTPLTLFEPARDRPSLLSPGDRVRFRPISEEEFTRWSPVGAP